MNDPNSHTNTHAKDTQYKHSHTFKTHLPSARLSAGGYSTRELIIVSLFHIFEKIQNLDGGMLLKHVLLQEHEAGCRPLRLKFVGGGLSELLDQCNSRCCMMMHHEYMQPYRTAAEVMKLQEPPFQIYLIFLFYI